MQIGRCARCSHPDNSAHTQPAGFVGLRLCLITALYRTASCSWSALRRCWLGTLWRTTSRRCASCMPAAWTLQCCTLTPRCGWFGLRLGLAVLNLMIEIFLYLLQHAFVANQPCVAAPFESKRPGMSCLPCAAANHARCQTFTPCLLCPHALYCMQGLPYRSALKVLALRFLKRKIQEGSHDSITDARTAMDLAQLKIRHGERLVAAGYGWLGTGVGRWR